VRSYLFEQMVKDIKESNKKYPASDIEAAIEEAIHS
jgi:hypothetical protein